MANLDKVKLQLRKERDEVQQRVEQLDQALAALGSPDGLRTTARGPQKAGRTMSAAARERIAAAQRARWVKWKAARRRK